MNKTISVAVNCTSKDSVQYLYTEVPIDVKLTAYDTADCGKYVNILPTRVTTVYVSVVTGPFTGDLLIRSAYMLASGVAVTVTVTVASLANLLF